MCLKRKPRVGSFAAESPKKVSLVTNGCPGLWLPAVRAPHPPPHRPSSALFSLSGKDDSVRP